MSTLRRNKKNKSKSKPKEETPSSPAEEDSKQQVKQKLQQEQQQQQFSKKNEKKLSLTAAGSSMMSNAKLSLNRKKSEFVKKFKDQQQKRKGSQHKEFVPVTEDDISIEPVEMAPETMQKVISHFEKQYAGAQLRSMGYPISQHVKLQASLNRFTRFPLVNTTSVPNYVNKLELYDGDEDEQFYSLNSLSFENAVIQALGQIFEAPVLDMGDSSKPAVTGAGTKQENRKKKTYDCWGFVSDSFQQANFAALMLASRKFENTSKNPSLYCSIETHSHIIETASLLRFNVVTIGTDSSGQILTSSLEESIDASSPVILILNNGTSTTGANDNIDEALEVLEKLKIKQSQRFVHVDGSVNGLIMPLLINAAENPEYKARRVTFKKEIDSVSLSGNTMLGCPMPCGAIVARVNYGSTWNWAAFPWRNGHSAIAMWLALQNRGIQGLREDALTCVSNANYLKQMLIKAEHRGDVSPYSATVIFDKPKEETMKKWNLESNLGTTKARVHVFPTCNRRQIHKLFLDLVAGDSVDQMLFGTPKAHTEAGVLI